MPLPLSSISLEYWGGQEKVLGTLPYTYLWLRRNKPQANYSFSGIEIPGISDDAAYIKALLNLESGSYIKNLIVNVQIAWPGGFNPMSEDELRRLRQNLVVDEVNYAALAFQVNYADDYYQQINLNQFATYWGLTLKNAIAGLNRLTKEDENDNSIAGYSLQQHSWSWVTVGSTTQLTDAELISLGKIISTSSYTFLCLIAQYPNGGVINAIAFKTNWGIDEALLFGRLSTLAANQGNQYITLNLERMGVTWLVKPAMLMSITEIQRLKSLILQTTGVIWQALYQFNQGNSRFEIAIAEWAINWGLERTALIGIMGKLAAGKFVSIDMAGGSFYWTDGI